MKIGQAFQPDTNRFATWILSAVDLQRPTDGKRLNGVPIGSEGIFEAFNDKAEKTIQAGGKRSDGS